MAHSDNIDHATAYAMAAGMVDSDFDRFGEKMARRQRLQRKRAKRGDNA